MDEPKWMLEEVVLSIHGLQLAEHGGIDGIRDKALLSSALHRPKGQFLYDKESDLASIAAAYAFGIAKNHPFNDGSKRTAAVVCETFIRLNGQLLSSSDEEVYLNILQLSSGQLSEEEFGKWLR